MSSLKSICTLYTHLFVSPDQVGLGIAGVMDLHLLLSNAAVTAAWGTAEGVVMQEYYSEQGAQDVRGHSHDEENFQVASVIGPRKSDWKKCKFICPLLYLFIWVTCEKWKQVDPTGKANSGQQKVGIGPTSV